MSIYIVGTRKVNFVYPSDYSMLIVGSKDNTEKDSKCKYDNEGDSISQKNPFFCELTALYWIWKNTSDKFVGLDHYRRFLWLNNPEYNYIIKNVHDTDKIQNMISFKDIHTVLEGVDIIVPRKWILGETVEKQYASANRKIDFDITRQVITELYPEYSQSFEKIAQGYQLYPCNMFLTRREWFDKYAKWLFTILFEVEKRTKIPYEDIYQRRIFGFLSERLFNVFLLHNNLKIKEVPIIFIDSKNENTDLKKGIKYQLYDKFPTMYPFIHNTYLFFKNIKHHI